MKFGNPSCFFFAQNQERPDKLGFGFWGLRFFVIILAKLHMEDEAIGRLISH